MSIDVTLVPYADAINKIGSKKKGFFPVRVQGSHCPSWTCFLKWKKAI